MEAGLEHEDLLIKLRAKLNEEKIKLWEAPYFVSDGNEISQSLKDLATKYAASLNMNEDLVTEGLRELQVHSLERLKANAAFVETGLATLRVRVTAPGERARMVKILKQLSIRGEELIESLAELLSVDRNRVKLIHNGKLIKPDPSLQEQGIKNGAQLMALVMPETPEQVSKEDKMYMEMKSTLDDVNLLCEHVEDLSEDDEYMKLEDQSGKAVELPPTERRALMVGLALHERGRATAQKKDYSLALVLLLEADRQLNECSSSLLRSVDNVAVLQLDIAWCYLCLRSLASAGDAAARLARAERAFRASYGEDQQRLFALKGNNANERVLYMRLYLLQGIVAYHQNKRAEAAELLAKAENELKYLKVDEIAVAALMELGWSRGQAIAGLRASGGDLDRAHLYQEDRRKKRQEAQERYRLEREQRRLGVCEDGSPVKLQLVEALQAMGFARGPAVAALRISNNVVADAVRLIQEQPELLVETEDSDDLETASSEDSLVEPDNKLVAELVSMGYPAQEARSALRLANNRLDGALDLLVGGRQEPCDPTDPSTSAAGVSRKLKREMREKRKKQRHMALLRLKKSIRTDEEEFLSASLAEEEQFLAQYKSLL